MAMSYPYQAVPGPDPADHEIPTIEGELVDTSTLPPTQQMRRVSSRHAGARGDGGGGGGRPPRKPLRARWRSAAWQVRHMTRGDLALWAVGPTFIVAGFFRGEHLWVVGSLLLIAQWCNFEYLAELRPRVKVLLLGSIIGAVLITQQPQLGLAVVQAGRSMVDGAQTAYQNATADRQPAAERPAQPTTTVAP